MVSHPPWAELEERRKEASATQKRIKWTEQAGNCGHQLLSSCLKGEPTDWSRSLQFYSHYLQSLHCATSYKCKASYCMLLALHNPSRRNRLLLVKTLAINTCYQLQNKTLARGRSHFWKLFVISVIFSECFSSTYWNCLLLVLQSSAFLSQKIAAYCKIGRSCSKIHSLTK